MILPTKTSELIEWCELRVTPWAAAPATIGLTAPIAAAFGTATLAARGAYQATQEAEQALKNARIEQANTIRNLRRMAGDDIRMIKAFAEMQPDPDVVYMAADIPPPATPTEMGPPGTPFDFRASLNTDGSLTINWKCTNPVGAAGTVYNVRRKLGNGNFEYVGSVGTRSFTDVTLPLGAGQVMYIVTGQRATSVGAPSLPLTIMFGVVSGPGGGGLTITQQWSGEMPVKMAA